MNRWGAIVVVAIVCQGTHPSTAEEPLRPQRLRQHTANNLSLPQDPGRNGDFNGPTHEPEIDRGERKSLPPRPAARSESSGSPGTLPKSSNPIYGVLTSLVLLGGMAASLAWWIKRHGPAQLRGLPLDAYEPLGQRPLGPRLSIQMVRCGQRILVLSVSPDSANTLAEISDPVELDIILGACRRKQARADDELTMVPLKGNFDSRLAEEIGSYEMTSQAGGRRVL